MVVYWRCCEPSDELVDVTYALGWAERIPRAVAVEFPEGLVVVVLMPFVGGEERAEGGYSARRGGDCFEGAEVHDLDCFAGG